MSPSVTFWVNTLTSLGICLTASASFLLLLGMNPRRRLNQTLGVLAACTAIVGLGSAISSISYWLNDSGLENGSGFGNPLFWIELAAAGFYFVGPALLACAVAYAESTVPVGKTDQNVASSQTRLSRLAAIIGFLVGLGLLPAIFSHGIIVELYMDQANLLRLKLSDLGYVASAGPVLFQLLAILLFWKIRKRPGGSILATSTAIWMAGSIFVILVTVPLPIQSLTFATSTILTGYAVFKYRIFDPPSTLTEQLEAKVTKLNRELHQARNELQRLNIQQLAIAQISREISQITDTTAILERLPDLIHELLGYQHIYIYEPDETNQYLVVRAAAGTDAKKVLTNRHEIPIGRGSLAGQVAFNHRAQLAEAQDEEAVYFTGTALPGARAEMALPLMVGDRLYGLLDLQSIHRGAFSDEDLAIMSSLTDQVAIALENALRFQETSPALVDSERSQKAYFHRLSESTVGAPELSGAYVYTETEGVIETSINSAWSGEMSQAVSTGPVLTKDGNDEHASLTLPILVRDRIIGAMQLRHKSGREWQPEEVDALSDLSERLGLALESARLSETAQQRTAQERIIREITDQMQQATDMEMLMRITVNQLNQALGGSRGYVRLGTELDMRPLIGNAQKGEGEGRDDG